MMSTLLRHANPFSLSLEVRYPSKRALGHTVCPMLPQQERDFYYLCVCVCVCVRAMSSPALAFFYSAENEVILKCWVCTRLIYCWISTRLTWFTVFVLTWERAPKRRRLGQGRTLPPTTAAHCAPAPENVTHTIQKIPPTKSTRHVTHNVSSMTGRV